MEISVSSILACLSPFSVTFYFGFFFFTFFFTLNTFGSNELFYYINIFFKMTSLQSTYLVS